MTSVFQVLAADSSEEQTQKRVATRIAYKRVQENFGDFIKAGSDNTKRLERFDLVADDLSNLVEATCKEYGFAADDDRLHHNILQGIRSSLVDLPKQSPEPRVASVHEARRPKLCPYHKEVTDISLTQGEPRAGYDAMAQHAWSAHHCQGSEYEGNKCNFKPEMVTQGYWDEKEEKAQERREQREQERAQQLEQEEAISEVSEESEIDETIENPETDAEVHPDESLPDNVIEVDFGNEDAEVESGVEVEVPMGMAASVDDGVPLDKTSDLGSEPTSSPLDLHDTGRDDSPGDVIAAYSDGTIVLDDGVTTENPLRALEFVQQGGKLQDAVDKVEVKAFPRGSKIAEALETIDVEGNEGPVPEIDKREWTPENLEQRVDTEGDGSPHPTREKDVTEPADFSDDDRFTETEAVLEKQDVTKDTEFSNNDGNTKSFPKGNQVNPVSSAVDVEKNPIREVLLEDDEGFLPEAEVTAAISATH